MTRIREIPKSLRSFVGSLRSRKSSETDIREEELLAEAFFEGEDLVLENPTGDEVVEVDDQIEEQQPVPDQEEAPPVASDFDRSQYTVTARDYDSWYGSARAEDFLAMTRQLLLPLVRKNIVVHAKDRCSGSSQRQDGIFHIFVWSSAGGDCEAGNRNRVTPSFWGVPFSRTLDHYGPAGIGVPIVDDSGVAVAELIGDNLFIFWPLASSRDFDSTRAQEIYRHILEEVAIEYSSDSVEIAAKLQQRELVNFARTQAEFRDLLERAMKRRREKLIARNRASKEQVRELQKQIVREIRQAAMRQREIDGLEQLDHNQLLQRSNEMLQQLRAVPKVTGVSISSEQQIVSVTTSTLFAQDDRTGKYHRIGRFRIDFNLDNGNVRWFNLTDRVRDIHHAPHVIGADGSACLGNTSETFPQLIGEYDLVSAAMLAISFVETANTADSAGKSVNSWPEATPEEMAEIAGQAAA